MALHARRDVEGSGGGVHGSHELDARHLAHKDLGLVIPVVCVIPRERAQATESVHRREGEGAQARARRFLHAGGEPGRRWQAAGCLGQPPGRPLCASPAVVVCALSDQLHGRLGVVLVGGRHVEVIKEVHQALAARRAIPHACEVTLSERQSQCAAGSRSRAAGLGVVMLHAEPAQRHDNSSDAERPPCLLSSRAGPPAAPAGWGRRACC